MLDRFTAELRLVAIIARQVRRTVGSAVTVEELESFGREGLLSAARRYDPERGVPFRAYANLRVRGAVLDGVRTIMPLPRRTHEKLRALQALNQYEAGIEEDTCSRANQALTPAQADQSLSEHLAAMATAMALGMVSGVGPSEDGEPWGASPEENPEEALSRAETLHSVTQALDSLPHQEAELVRRHYLGGERLDQIAKDLHLSKSWASRLHSRAVARLSEQLRNTT